MNTTLKKTLSSPGGVLAFILLMAMGLVLLVYTASRSLDFIQLTLPDDKKILGYCGLVALDGGLLLWLFNFLYGCHGPFQRGISILMVVVDFIGAMVMFNLDTVYNTGKAGLTAALTQDEVLYAVIALGVIISMNIGMEVLFHIVDPAAQARAKQQSLMDKINSLAMDQVEQQSPEIAAMVAPAIARQMVKNQVGGVITEMGLGVDTNKLTALFQDKDKNGVPDLFDQMAKLMDDKFATAVVQLQAQQAAQQLPDGERRPVGRPKGSSNGKVREYADIGTLDDDLVNP